MNRPKTIVSQREGLVFERSIPSQNEDGLFRIDQRIESRGTLERSIVTGTFWIFAAVMSETGLTEARAGGKWTALPGRRAFLIPPRSVLRLRLSEVRLDAHGIVGQAPLPNELAKVPRAAGLCLFGRRAGRSFRDPSVARWRRVVRSRCWRERSRAKGAVPPLRISR
jgi:hypothetical protein